MMFLSFPGKINLSQLSTSDECDILSCKIFIGRLGKLYNTKQAVREKRLYLGHGMYGTAEVTTMMYQRIRCATGSMRE